MCKFCQFCQILGQLKTMDLDHASVHINKDDMKISFFYNGDRKDLNRKKEDILEKTFQRIAIKVQPKAKKKKKENEEKNSPTVSCSIIDGDNEISKELKNEEGFLHGRCLHINDNKYLIHVNPPMVLKLELQKCIMAGFPIIPNITFELACIENSKFSWYKSNGDFKEWVLVGEGLSYFPLVSDIDYRLKCVCLPGNGSISGPFSKKVVSEELVKAGPGICLYDQRHLFTPSYFPITGSQFRMITYNILANVFADTEYAREKLFPFCPPYAIKADYRRQLLLKEFIGYNSDLICLQECSLNEYENYLVNWMSLHGYGGYLKLKLGEMSEGEAFFYRREKFDHIEDLSVSMSDALLMPCNAKLLEKLSDCQPFLENIKGKKAIGQIHLLREKEGSKRYLLVLNTHLYYKRFSMMVRLVQISILMNYISEVVKQHKEHVSVIVSGDLNTLRGEPLLDYLKGDAIEKNLKELSPYVKNPTEEGLMLKLDFTCPIRLNLLSGIPDFTSYVPHCKATLDYIFSDSSISMEQFIPLPLASEIDPYVGVPCIVYPSDHLAVVLDLKWN